MDIDIFVNRKAILNYLIESTNSITKKNPPRIALIGPRKIGKTSLLWKLAEKIKQIPVIYVDIKSINGSPKEFGWRYLGTVIKQIEKNDINIFNRDEVIRTAQKSKDKNILRAALTLESADDITAVTTTLNLPETFTEPCLIIFDEFQGILKLDRFKQIDSILQIFRDIFQRSSNGYIISGSEISILENVLNNSASPLFGHFNLKYLHSLPEKDTLQLAKNILKKFDRNIENTALRYLARVTNKCPYYTIQVTKELISILIIQDKRLAKLNDVKRAIFNTVISAQGELYVYFNYLFDLILKRTESLRAKDALLFLCDNNISIHGLAKRMEISDAESSKILKRLLELDVISKKDRIFYVPDFLFKFWLNESYLHNGTPEIKHSIDECLSILEEKYLEAKTGLGHAFEAQMRDLIRKFNGQEPDGRIFGVDRKLKLPRVRTVESVSLGEIGDIDALLSNGEHWAVEIKNINKPIGPKQLKKFQKAILGLELSRNIKVTYRWYISYEGFSSSGRVFASNNNILISDWEDIQKLARFVKYRLK